MLDNYTVGASTSGITMVVTQSGADVTVDVQGLAGLALALFTANPDPMRGTATPLWLLGQQSRSQRKNQR
jgi:hypothetical protein